MGATVSNAHIEMPIGRYCMMQAVLGSLGTMSIPRQCDVRVTAQVVPYVAREIDPTSRPLLYGTTALFFCQALWLFDFAYDMYPYGLEIVRGRNPLTCYAWE